MWEPLAPAAEGGGEGEREEPAKLESCLAPSFLLLLAWYACLYVYFLLNNCPMLGTLFRSIHSLGPSHGLDPSLPYMSVAKGLSLKI